MYKVFKAGDRLFFGFLLKKKIFSQKPEKNENIPQFL